MSYVHEDILHVKHLKARLPSKWQNIFFIIKNDGSRCINVETLTNDEYCRQFYSDLYTKDTHENRMVILGINVVIITVLAIIFGREQVLSHWVTAALLMFSICTSIYYHSLYRLKTDELAHAAKKQITDECLNYLDIPRIENRPTFGPKAR